MSVRLSDIRNIKQSMGDKVLEGVIFYISGKKKKVLLDEFTFEQRPECRERVICEGKRGYLVGKTHYAGQSGWK